MGLLGGRRRRRRLSRLWLARGLGRGLVGLGISGLAFLAVSCVWGWGLVQFFEFLDNPLVAGAVGVVAADVLPLDLAVLVDDESCGGGASGAVAVEYAVLLDYLAVGVV